MRWTLFLQLCMLFFTMPVLVGQEPTVDPEADQVFPLHGDYAASHILISHTRADKAGSHVTRNKKEALAFAREIAALLKADPSSFDELARTKSDAPSAPIAGNLKTFPKGRMAPSFEEALRKLDFGAITSSPVKTPFGYHLIRRNPMEAKHYGARAIIIAHEESARIKGIPADSPAWSRSKADALTYIKTLAAKVKAEGFDGVEASSNDLKKEQGFMGVFKPGDGKLTDMLIQPLKDLKYDDVSDVQDVGVGWALLQRVRVEKRAGSRILIAYKGANRAGVKVSRTQEEAAALAGDLCKQLAANPAGFDDLAKKHSNGPFAVRAGQLPNWFTGYQPLVVERAYQDLSVGGITSVPLETAEGYQIFRRNRLK